MIAGDSVSESASLPSSDVEAVAHFLIANDYMRFYFNLTSLILTKLCRLRLRRGSTISTEREKNVRTICWIIVVKMLRKQFQFKETRYTVAYFLCTRVELVLNIAGAVSFPIFFYLAANNKY